MFEYELTVYADGSKEVVLYKERLLAPHWRTADRLGSEKFRQWDADNPGVRTFQTIFTVTRYVP